MANPEQLDLTGEQIRKIETITSEMEADQNLTLEQFKEKEREINELQAGIDSDLIKHLEPRMLALYQRFENREQ
jgi:hypothetical protein